MPTAPAAPLPPLPINHPPVPPLPPGVVAFAPLTNNERPVSISTGEKTPNGCAKPTNVVSGSVPAPAAALTASACAYPNPPLLSTCTNCA